MTSRTRASSAPAALGSTEPVTPSLSEQLTDALAEDFSILEYIELILDGYQFWHKRIHLYDELLRHDFLASTGSNPVLIIPEAIQLYQRERAAATENLLKRRAQWVAALGEIKVVRERISRLDRLIAAKKKAAEAKKTEEEEENEEENEDEEEEAFVE